MSDSGGSVDIPQDKQDSVERARRLEMWSLFFLFTIVVLLGFTMGSSQAMKAMWLEDTLSLVPSSAVLVGIYMRRWAPNDRFPYGYRRAVQIGFLAGAVALFGFGLYLLIDSIYSLIIAHHPTIQTIEIFGNRVWLGWLMIAALVYSIFPPLILGQMKKPLASELHDKALYTSATIDKGDWLSGIAGILGILGIAYGYWWADSVAAGFISFEITKDGIENLKNSVFQLMNMHPTDVESKEKDPIYDRVKEEIAGLDWVRQSQVRLREDGDILAGEAFVVPSDENGLLEKLREAGERIKALDWRLQDFNIVPVRTIR
jgi:cation diffusion facilitator family transporter